MKKYIYAGWVKALAVVLINISVLVGAGSVFCVILSGEELTQGYENIFNNQAAGLLAQNAGWEDADYSRLEGGNLSYAVLKMENRALDSQDLKDSRKYVYRSSDFDPEKCQYMFGYVPSDALRYNTSTLLGMLTTNAYTIPDEASATEASGQDKYWVLGTVRSPIDSTAGDPYAQWSGWIQRVQCGAGTSGWAVLLCILICIASFAYLMKSAGRRPGREGIVLAWTDKVWFGVLWFVIVSLQWLAVCCMVLIADVDMWEQIPDMLFVEIELLLAAALLCLGLLGITSTVVRLKAHCFWRYTLLHAVWTPVKAVLIWLCAWLRRIRKKHRQTREMLREHIPLVAKTAGLLVAVNFIEFLACLFVMEITWSKAMGFIFVAFTKIVEGAAVILAVVQMAKLKEGGERIAGGDISVPIDTRNMFWEFRRHGENINKVGDGINLAVQERMKSEHFKTELITNVSHDIKTPLTSMINYVDLMKKLEVKDPTMLEYMDVLDRQSARLKKLIEDLMEASKASTGSLEVNMEKCDMSVLFTQMIGEFKERAAETQLQFVVKDPGEPVYIMADGRHLWRVFDNLLVNICKYAMPKTRVYIDLKVESGNVVIIFKNISKQALNIDKDELMERFVRGDSSRNTEGNGLGLSIAQSLTELMGGTMALDIDGDLFKVTLQFPSV